MELIFYETLPEMLVIRTIGLNSNKKCFQQISLEKSFKKNHLAIANSKKNY